MFLDHNEAILFRLLTSFFGHDQVVPQMSVLAVCGGSLPASSVNMLPWSKSAKCLFTVVDGDDVPKLVIELGVDNKESIDISELDKQQQLKFILQTVGITYIVLSRNDFSFITDPKGPENWFLFLQDRFEHAMPEA